MLSVAAYKIENYPLPVLIGTYPSDNMAQKAERNNVVHNAISNKNVVISFPSWGSDTEEMQNKIKNAFNEFKY